MGRIDALLEQRRALGRFALTLTRDPDAAEDLVQETFSKAIAVMGSTPVRQLRPWLFAILHNEWRRQFRKRKATVLLDDDLPEVATGTPDAGFAAQVIRAVESLPPDQAAVLRLVAIEDMTYAEVAAILDIPLGTVMSRLSRGRARLRAILGEPKVVPLRRPA